MITSVYRKSFTAAEGMSWSVYESLISSYAADFKYGHVTIVLRRDLTALQRHLLAQRTEYAREAASRLYTLLREAEIDLDASARRAKTFIPLKFPNREKIDYEKFKRFSMFRNLETEVETGRLSAKQSNIIRPEEVQGSCEMLQSGRPIIREMKEKVNTRIPMLRVRNDYYMNDQEHNYAKVHVNDAFSVVFGLSSEELEERIRTNVGGFLPFGAHVLAYVAEKESELLQHVQVMCIKSSTHDPTNLPFYNEIPSAQCMQLKVRKSSLGTEVEPMPCMVQTVYRRFIDEEKCYSETYLLISPLESCDHLFDEYSENALEHNMARAEVQCGLVGEVNKRQTIRELDEDSIMYKRMKFMEQAEMDAKISSDSEGFMSASSFDEFSDDDLFSLNSSSDMQSVDSSDSIQHFQDGVAKTEDMFLKWVMQ